MPSFRRLDRFKKKLEPIIGSSANESRGQSSDRSRLEAPVSTASTPSFGHLSVPAASAGRSAPADTVSEDARTARTTNRAGSSYQSSPAIVIDSDSLRTGSSAAEVSATTSVDAAARTNLWDGAFNRLLEQSPDLCAKYVKLLQKLDPVSREDHRNSDPPSVLDRAQLLAIGQKALAQLDEQGKLTVGGHQLNIGAATAQISNGLLRFKDGVGAALEASPQASLAWSAVCLLLPLLTSSHTAAETNRDALTYITSRMHYYTALEPLIYELGQCDGSEAMNQAYESIICLYRSILDFMINSVLRFEQNHYKRYVGDVMQLQDWKKKEDDIRKLEETVDKNLRQIDNFIAGQKLRDLNKICEKNLENLQRLLSSSDELVQLAKQQRNVEAERMLSKRREECHQCFRLTSGDKDSSYEWYKERVGNRIEGTCEWFLKRKEYQDWLTGDTDILLVTADPGCGKSVLAKYLIDDMSKSATVCYFFFKDQDQNTVRQALCALLHQLFSLKPDLIDHALPKFKRNGPGLVNVTASLWKILDEALRDPEAGKVTIVLDALDECAEDELENLIQHVTTDVQETHLGANKPRFLFTGRPCFRVLRDLQNQVHIPGEQFSDEIGNEINLVIKYRIRQFSWASNLEAYLIKRMTAIQHRTYLWVYLVFDYIKRQQIQKTRRGIDSLVTNLPKNVTEAYNSILSQSKDRNDVMKALEMILAATRPLTVAEMNVAFNVDDDPESIHPEQLEDDKDFANTLRELCGLFVSIYHHKVYFLHQTAREFLLSRPASRRTPSSGSSSIQTWQKTTSERAAHKTLARQCLFFLAHLEAPIPADERRSKAFSYYSAMCWYDHFRRADVDIDDPMIELAMEISDINSIVRSRWTSIHPEPPGYVTDKPSLTKASNLTLASIFGHATLVTRYLGAHDVDVNLRDHQGRTPLVWAVKSNRPAVVEMLLGRKDVDISFSDDFGRSPLWWAASQHSAVIVKLLLDTGRIDLVGESSGDSPLHITTYSPAEKQPSIAIVRMLLNSGFDVNSRNPKRRTPLLSALHADCTDIARIFLKLPGCRVKVNIQDSDGCSALHLATTHGKLGIVQLLLAYEGIDVEIRNKCRETALHTAVSTRQIAILQLFLEDKRFDINTEDRKGRTPLMLALNAGYLDAMSTIVRSPRRLANVNVQDQHGSTALHKSASRGNVDSIKVLLAYEDNDVNLQDERGQTALHSAVIWSQIATVKLLLEDERFDINLRDHEGRAPWQRAIGPPNQVILNSFLMDPRLVVDINLQDSTGETALHMAMWDGDVAIVELLLAQGDLDVNLQDRKGRTALDCAFEWRRVAISKMLLADIRCKPTLEDAPGPTPLFLAVARWDVTAVRLLLSSHEADVDSKNRNGETARSWALKQYNRQTNCIQALDPQIKSRDMVTFLDRAVVFGASPHGSPTGSVDFGSDDSSEIFESSANFESLEVSEAFEGLGNYLGDSELGTRLKNQWEIIRLLTLYNRNRPGAV